MKKSIIKFFTFIVLFIQLAALSGCGLFDKTPGTKDPSTFDAVTKQIFATLIGQDELTINYLIKDREAFGLEHYEPSLPTPQVTSILSLGVTNILLGQVKQYDYSLLDEDQKMVYNIISELLDYINGKNSTMSYLDNNYLGTYLGYQAQLPLLLCEYHYNSKIDIENYFKFLDLIPETFQKYYDFEVKKAEKGYGMADYVIDNVVSQCDTFIENIDNANTFMLTVVNQKFDSCTFLTENEKELYKKINTEKVSGPLKEGYAYIKENLPNLKGKAKNEYGLAYYVTDDGIEIGKQYFENEFKHVVGYDISCTEAISYLENVALEELEEIKRLSTLINENQKEKEDLTAILNGDIKLMTKDPYDQLIYYNTLTQKDFPKLSYTPQIIVKYIDESMQHNFSPAAYMTSALDDYTKESIYLNPLDVYLTDEEGNLTTEFDSQYLYTTLAHEGIPGHMYQNIYFKSLENVNILRRIIKNSGYTEGWATYVENYMYNYLRDDYGDHIAEYMIATSKLQAAVYSRIDIGIHYDGWKVTELKEYMGKFYAISSDENIEKAFKQLVEIPTNYSQYFYTYLKLCDMYDLVKNQLGGDFSAVDFHKTVLDCGSVPLKYVEKIVIEKYIQTDSNE